MKRNKTEVQPDTETPEPTENEIKVEYRKLHLRKRLNRLNMKLKMVTQNKQVINMKEKVNNLDNKPLKEIELDKNIFSIDLKEEIIHRMVRYQPSKRRSG